MSTTRSKKAAVAAVVANGGGTIGGGSLGRIQLKGVLDGLVKRSINEEKLTDDITVDGDVEEAARDLLELNSCEINGAAITLAGAGLGGGAVGGATVNSRKRPTTVRRRGRKRRRKDCIYLTDSSDDESKERHIPHVMTLFDRKVDLARFTVTTPIYTMCRDWMSNNPNKLHHYGNSNNGQPPTPSVGSAVLNHTGEAMPNDSVHLSDSTHLPAPIPLPTDVNGGVVRLDIPKPLPPHMNGSDGFDKVLENSEEDMATYKAAHLKRWKEIRSQWRKASALNQARYTDSLRVLREMFQR